jgi:hypothetical protein
VEKWVRDAIELRRSLPDELVVEKLDDQRLRLRRGPHSLTIDVTAMTLDYAS